MTLALNNVSSNPNGTRKKRPGNARVEARSRLRIPLRSQCPVRWEPEHVLEAVKERLDRNPDEMRTLRDVVEDAFGTLKMRMGATHFLMKTLPKVATEMALAVFGYNLTRVINIVGVARMIEAVKGVERRQVHLPRLYVQVHFTITRKSSRRSGSKEQISQICRFRVD